MNTFAAMSISGSVYLLDVINLTVDHVGAGTFVTNDMAGVVATGAGQSIELHSNGNLTLDSVVSADQKAGAVRLQAGTSITQTATGLITANQFSAQSNGLIDLCHIANDVNVFAAMSTSGSVSFLDAIDLTVDHVGAGTFVTNDLIGVIATGESQNIELNSNGKLALNQQVASNLGTGTVRLQGDTNVTQTAVGLITANQLSAQSKGPIDLSHVANDVNTFAALSASGSVYFLDANDLTIDHVGPGTCVTTDLSGVVANGVGQNIELHSNGKLTLNLQLASDQNTGTVRLQGDNNITQNGTGLIIANQFSAQSNGLIDLSQGKNEVNTFAAMSISGSVYLLDVINLTVDHVGSGTFVTTDLSGVVATGAGQSIELHSNGKLTLNQQMASDLGTGTIRLQGDTNVTQAAAGVITANQFSAQSNGMIDLSHVANDVNAFAALSTSGSVFFLDAIDLTIDHVDPGKLVTTDLSGVVTAGVGQSIELHSNGKLTLDLQVASEQATGTVRLQGDTNITQTATGVITSNQLSAQSNGLIDLSHVANDVNTFAALSTSGSVYFLDANDLTINHVGPGTCVTTDLSGVVASGVGQNIELHSNGKLTLNQQVASDLGTGTVRLQGDTSVTQAAAGVITANQFSAQSNGLIDLSQGKNEVNTFAATSVNKSISFYDKSKLTVGTVAGGTCVAATQTGVTALGVDGVVELHAKSLMTTSTGVVRADTVNLLSENDLLSETSIGSGKINYTKLETDYNVTDWSLILNSNPSSFSVVTLNLNISGTKNGAPVIGSVWVDVNPEKAGATVQLNQFSATGDVVLTSKGLDQPGTLNINNVSADGHVLIYTESAGANVALGYVHSGLTVCNSIVVDAGGTLSQLKGPNPYMISTGTHLSSTGALTDLGMILRQLGPDLTIPAGSVPLDAASQLSAIYANYDFFQIEKTFPSPSESIIRPLQVNSIQVTIGQGDETGWHYTILWGDGKKDENVKLTNSMNGASSQISHLYDTLNSTAKYEISVTVFIDQSISLATHSNGVSTFYEQRTLKASALASAVPPPPSIFATQKQVPLTPVPVIAVSPLGFTQPFVKAPDEIQLGTTEVQNLTKKKFLTLSLIPEDDSEPVALSMTEEGILKIVEGSKEEQSQLQLELLNADRLIEQFKGLPDGRYRLKLHRNLGDETLDERTVLETIIINGAPLNPVEEIIEQLRRNLDRKTESDRDVKAENGGASLMPIPNETSSVSGSQREIKLPTRSVSENVVTRNLATVMQDRS